MLRMTVTQLGVPGTLRLCTTDGGVLGFASHCGAAEPSRGGCNLNLTFLERGT